ncbi:MAG: WbuC family cupin fold metalloprotein [Candidatus Omnitrophota bacterium]
MIKIKEKLLTETAAKAKDAERKRCNHNFHKDPADPINRMLNAMEKGTYFCPHKHENPDKREIFIILKGRVLIAEFNENGRVTDHITLDPEKGNMGVEIPPKVWHTLVPLAENSVLYEIKDGPYNKDIDKTFPEWAPKEGEEDTQEFVDRILKEVGGVL